MSMRARYHPRGGYIEERMRVRIAVACVLGGGLAGCAGSNAELCRPGFARGQDGHCYPPLPDDPPTFVEVLEGMGPCARLKNGDEIDAIGGCMGGACAGDTFSETVLALGDRDTVCDQLSTGEWECLWPQGIAVSFPPAETDAGAPSPGTLATWIRARYDYEGATPDGLGIGISVSCFVEVLGLPDTVLLVPALEELVPQELEWLKLGIEIEDEEREVDLLSMPDGLVDEITLSGPQ
jgi:hypothetical protein